MVSLTTAAAQSAPKALILEPHKSEPLPPLGSTHSRKNRGLSSEAKLPANGSPVSQWVISNVASPVPGTLNLESDK